MSERMKRQRTGFTLIELLVVIAIIAILAAMLMPALERARDGAIQVTCTSRMKQQGTAFVMYSHSYDGAWPYLHDRQGHAGGLSYKNIDSLSTLVEEYSGGTDTTWTCPDGRRADGSSWDSPGQYLSTRGGGFYYAGLSRQFKDNWIKDTKPYDYLADGQVMRWYVDPPDSGYAFRELAALDGNTWRWGVKAANNTILDRAPNVSDKVVSGEMSQCDRWHSMTGWKGPGGGMRHGAGRGATFTGGNVMFGDSHVEWVDVSDGFGCVTDSSKQRISYFFSVPFINWYRHNGGTITNMPGGWGDYQQYYESY